MYGSYWPFPPPYATRLTVVIASLLLASALLGFQERISGDDVEGVVRDLIVEFREGSDRFSDARGIEGNRGDRAAAAIVKVGDVAVPRLILALKSDNDWTRVHASECLRDLRAQTAYKPLDEAIRDEKQPHVKSWLISCLGATGGSAAIPELTRFASSKEGEIASGAVTGLGYTHDPKAIPTLLEHLADKGFSMSGRETLNYAASEALAEIGSPAVDPLRLKLSSSNEDEAQAAAYSLSLIKDPRVTPLILSSLKTERGKKLFGDVLWRRTEPEIIPGLMAMVSDPDLELQAIALSALKWLKYKGPIAPICDSLERAVAFRQKAGDDSRPVQFDIVSHAAAVLSSTGDKAAIPVLRRALESVYDQTGTKDSIAKELIFALSRLHPAGLDPLYLKFALRHCDTTDESSAEAAAYYCGGSRELKTLRDAFRAGRIPVSVYAAALGSAKDEASAGLLAQEAMDKNESVRRDAVWGLGNLKSQAATDALKSLMRDKGRAPLAAQQLLRQGRLEGLRFYYDHPFDSYESDSDIRGELEAFPTPVLVEGLGRVAERLRTHLAAVLAARHDPNGLLALQKIASAGQEDSAIAAIKELAKMKSKESRPAVLKAMGRSEVWVRVAALFALRELDG